MLVRVLVFGPLKFDLGGPSIDIDLPEPGTVASLRLALAARFPSRAALLRTARLAINQAFAAPDQPIRAGDEIALIELVGGG
jgi:molybdopterin converting factor small subunit